MSRDPLGEKIVAAIDRDEPFGPADDDDQPYEVPARTLREAILSSPVDSGGEKRLRMRRIKIVGDLDLEAQRIGLRLQLSNCELTGNLNFRQARAIDIVLIDCVLRGELYANQAELRWNLRLNGSEIKRSASLLGAKIGGQLSLDRAKLSGVRGDGGAVGPAFNADRLEVSGTMFCDEISAEGEVRLLGAKVGGQLSLNKAQLKGMAGDGGGIGPAFNADGLEVNGDLFLREISAEGEVRLLGAKVGGQLSLNKAQLKGMAGDGGGIGPAFNADRVEVGGGMFCDEMSTEGEVRLLGSGLAGQLSLDDARLKGMAGDGGGIGPALNADGAEVNGGLFCDRLSTEGEVRLLGAKVGGQISLDGARLKGMAGDGGGIGPAFNADGLEVSGAVLARAISTEGELRLVGAKVDGQLAVVDASLNSSDPNRDCLTLTGVTVDELILVFAKVEGAVNLTDTKTRSLWDAEGGKFVGKLPDTLKLQGLRYESLREPLSAAQRLEWIERSQRQQHYPGVYSELADAYRRIGRRADAREVGVANERRGREDGALFKRVWSYVLWKSVRYGYENWRAAVGLVMVIAAGSVLFGINQDHFVATTREPPCLSPVIYATDAAIPVLDLGQTRTWTATGWLEWIELALAISGYALVAAVIAGLAGIFNRDQV